jgi:redox-sensitive bicupin YhaK (pirin superfamily)
MATPSASILREVTRVVAAQIHRNGNGITIHRAFPVEHLERVDPFLSFEQLGPTELERRQAGGELERRSEGVDAITYVVRGELEHEDETGFRTVLRTGDVQWLTTGSGLICSQLPSRSMREQGGLFHVLQIRADLPQHLKGVAPRYQTFGKPFLPEVIAAGVRITVVAGEALGIRGPVETLVPTTFGIWSLNPGAALTVPMPAVQHAFVYVLSGTVGVGGDGRAPRELGEGHLGLLGSGDAVRIHGYVPPGDASLVLVAAGVPIGDR